MSPGSDAGTLAHRNRLTTLGTCTNLTFAIKKHHNTNFNHKQMQCTTKQEMFTSFANDESDEHR